LSARRRSVLLRLLALWCFLATTAACSSEPALPKALVDGSPATSLPTELATIGGMTIVTRVEVVPVAELAGDSAAASCVARHGADVRQGPIVTRTGVDGESVTFRAASAPGRGLHACDGTDPREVDHRWCGSAYGRLDGGRLPDPRLDLTCKAPSGEPTAFAWVDPDADARFVAVRQPGFVEVYEVAADLPVRVTTRKLDLEESGATFEISEHDERGALLRAYTLRARVAG
jgi:hypothetical protein